MAQVKLTEKEIVRLAMRILGQRTSQKKKKSSAANGKLGGRPRIKK